MQNVLLAKSEKFILNYNKENYEQTKTNSLFHQNFVKKKKICEDVSYQYNMLLEISQEAF